MFKRILVPLDGSPRAERALLVAARIARASGAELVLARVVEITPLVGYEYQLMPVATEADLAVARVYLAGIAKREELSGLEPRIEVIEDGNVGSAILDAAARLDCDLLVLCSHGRSGIKRWALGSVAQKLAHHATVPVLVVRVDGPIPAHPHPDPDRPFQVLVPLDGSALAEAALTPAVQLVTALSSPGAGALHLVRAVPVAYEGTERGERVLMDHDTRSAVLEDAKAYLREVAERLRTGESADGHCSVTWSVLQEEDAAAAILSEAEGAEDAEGSGPFGRCDSIAMATHGRTGLRLWALGSIADRVLQTTKLPLLIVRPPAQAFGTEDLKVAEVGKDQVPADTFGVWPGLG